jgi:hypothetical protein
MEYRRQTGHQLTGLARYFGLHTHVLPTEGKRPPPFLLAEREVD